MSFWNGEKLKQALLESKVVTTLDGNVVPESVVVNGAYELSLGPDAFLTSDDSSKKQSIKEGEQIVVPAGQFGLLLTEERVTIPNAIGFISIKAGIKFRGLINVSGFHVDSGFSGRLKFAVYNAGSQNIVLERKQRVFLLWLSGLDQPTAPYSGVHANQDTISPDDVMNIQGEIASPGQLKKEIQELQIKFDRDIQNLDNKILNLKFILTAIAAIIVSTIGFSMRSYFQRVFEPQQSLTQTNLSNAGVSTTHNGLATNGPAFYQSRKTNDDANAR